MATISHAIVDRAPNATQITWETLTTTNSDGAAYGGQFDAIRLVQVKGTFGAGGEVTIQGSLDQGTTWATLNDPVGNALVLTAAGIEQVQEGPLWIRPLVTNGDGSTDLDVIIVEANRGGRGR